MADSQKVENSNSGFSKDENRDFHRMIPYDPAVLKRRKLWNKSDLSSGELFGRMGASNGKNSQANTLQSHQGDRKENPPDSKHKAGDTQKYNGPSESRSHGARGNNGAGVRGTGASVQYPSQSIHKGRGSLGNTSGGRSYNSDSRSHGARGNGGSGVRTLGPAVQYPSQSVRRSRAGLAPAKDGLKYNSKSDSRSHGERDN